MDFPAFYKTEAERLAWCKKVTANISKILTAVKPVLVERVVK